MLIIMYTSIYLRRRRRHKRKSMGQEGDQTSTGEGTADGDYIETRSMKSP
jgi:hypothetical protein